MSKKFVQTPAVALLAGISAAATSMTITPYPLDLDGNKLVMADFGTIPTATIDPGVYQYEEIVSFTGITDNGDGTATLTGLTRDLQSKSPYTSSGTGKQHGSSAVVVFSNNPQMYADFALLDGDNVFTGSNSFPVPTVGSNPATKDYVDTAAFNGAGPASTTAYGLVKLSTVPGDVLATPTITIASPAVVTSAAHGLVAGDLVKFTTSGALPTGIVSGTVYYVISAGLTTNTFQIAATLGGTAINTSGTQSGTHVLTRMTPIAIADTDPRLPLQGENDAMAGGGNFGTPSSSNKFITQQFLTTGVTRFGGTGADGALNVTTGTTTIDLGGAILFTKNYTSINISNGATVNFTNPHAQGTIIRLKSTGAVTIAGTLDASGMGAAGGASSSTGNGNNGNIGNGILENTNTGGIAGTAVGGGTAGVGFTYPIKSFYTRSDMRAITKSVFLYSGSGGGSGCASTNGGTPNGTGGAGGNGGGGVYIECAGALIFTGTINASGKNGQATISGQGSGGGGGSAGIIAILANVITTNSGTMTTTGGAGGGNTGGAGSPANSGNGGGGAGSWTGGGGAGANPGTNSPSNGAGGGGATAISTLSNGGTGGASEGGYVGLNTELY